MKKAFKKLKKTDFSNHDCFLAVVSEYKKNRESKYSIKYVKIEEKLQKRLKRILLKKVETANSFEDYTYDCPDPEGDQVRAINYASTDFYAIHTTLVDINPEVDVIENVSELLKTKSYMIILRDEKGISLVGFKKLIENWKLKHSKGWIPLFFDEEMFKDLEQTDVFNISSTIDFFYFEEALMILNKKNFETSLNFREGMLSKANDFYESAIEEKLFDNIEILKSKVGNNQRYLRKIATIVNLGYYQNQDYINKLKKIAKKRGWNISIKKGQFVLTEDNLEDVLTVLQNKRLHSELTDETFDISSGKKVE